MENLLAALQNLLPRAQEEPKTQQRQKHHANTVYALKSWEILAEWERYAERLKAQLALSTGAFVHTETLLGKAKQYDAMEICNICIEKVLLECADGSRVTGNLYRPNGDGPFPAVLCPHGHWDNGRLERTEICDVPARCIDLATNGFVAFSYDMIGFCDSLQLEHAFGDAALWNKGISPLALQFQNSKVSVDFVAALPYVDAARLGCTGASGGATQTLLLAALDERIAACAPVNMVSHKMQGGCCCENAPLLRVGTNNVEIASLIAPRPMLITGCTGDWTNELPHIEYPAIRRVYALYGAEAAVAYDYCEAPHNYNKRTREAVVNWFIALWGEKNAPWFEEPDYEGMSFARLRLFPDHLLPEGMVSGGALLHRIEAHKRRAAACFCTTGETSQLRNALRACFCMSQAEPACNLSAEVLQGDVYARLDTVTIPEYEERVQLYRFEKAGANIQQHTVVFHEGGAMALDADAVLLKRAQELLVKNHAVIFVDLFGSEGKPFAEVAEDRTGKQHLPELWEALCYEPSAAARKIRSMAVAISCISRQAAVHVLAYGSCAWQALCASAVGDQIEEFACDLPMHVLLTDTFPHDSCTLPLFQSIGGIASCLRLLQDQKTMPTFSGNERIHQRIP